MANVNPTASGSGEFSAQHAELPHLLKHGLSKEVADVRKDVAAVFKPDSAFTIDEWDGPGASSVLILGHTPKLRMGAVQILAEYLDGVAIAPVTGTLTQPGGAGTAWQYNPATAVNASTAGAATGTADLSASSLYGAAGTLNGLTLVLTVNGVLHTLTFSSPVNPTAIPPVSPTVLNPPLSLLQIINLAFPGLTATINGSNHLVLTDKLLGSTQSIVIGAGTGNTALGISAGTHAGTGHSYAIHYEYDATTIPNASATVQGGAPYVNTNQGP